MKTILNAEQIRDGIDRLADQIIAGIDDGVEFAFVGIRSRGEIVAQRLAAVVSEKLSSQIDCGTLDITLYRDDLNDPHSSSQPTVRSTEIDFDINDKVIILVDDVLHTGRSTRAALDALNDFGRPRVIRLAVLIDRAGREYPIQADYLAATAQEPEGAKVQVNLVETDDVDQVIVE
jgi:pyrimidine operon attenuation protein/uracil phosphoribosyltransferase